MIGLLGNASYLNYQNQYQLRGTQAGGAAEQSLAKGVNLDGTQTTAENQMVSSQGVTGVQKGECQTCKNRKYKDGSNDPGVSYKTPTKIDAKAAAAAVMGHEREHVSRERSKAVQEGREVVSQSVVMKRGICPECGMSYVSGGETRTVTKGPADKYQAGIEDPAKQQGANFDKVA